MFWTERTFATAGAAALALAVAACNGSGGSGGLSVSARSTAASAGVTGNGSGLLLKSGIEIDRVRMAVQKVSVEGGDAKGACPDPSLATSNGAGGMGGASPMVAASLDPSSAGSAEPSGSDDGCERSFGPFAVDLAGGALAGGVSWAFDVPIPAGTYEEIAVKVNTVPAAKSGGNPVLDALAALTPPASIVVDGWVDPGTSVATPFSFSTPMEVKQQREGAITIGPGANVTLDFDPSHWFDGASGRLDPNDPANQGAILGNIRASLKLVSDDDHDGCDDDPVMADSACVPDHHGR